MEHIAALLLIVGCSDDLSKCQELPVPMPIYEAIEECEAELQPSISLFTTRHPQVFGQCVWVDPAIEEEDAELVWNMKPDGTLVAMIEVPEIMIAATTGSGKDNTTHE